MALAEYDDHYWFPSGAMAANIPARVFPLESSTLAPLFADATGATPLPNPLNTGPDGRLHFWAEAGIYWVHIDSETFRVGIGVNDGGLTPADVQTIVDQSITAYNADTTDVHGIADTALLETVDGAQAKADAAEQGAVVTAQQATAAAVAAHAADTTDVHGITDTSTLETTTGAQAKADAAKDQAIAAAAADATTKADAAQQAAIAAAAVDATTKASDAIDYAASTLSAHAADTTNVHGIPDTADLLTGAALDGITQELHDHEADTTDVHGIPDTSQLLTQAAVDGLATQDQVDAVAADLAAHAADTTDVHGIPDTSTLETTTGAQAKADAAQAAAISTAAADATTKANAGRDAAIADAATKYLAKTGGDFTGTLRGTHPTDPTQAAFATQVTAEAFDRFRELVSGQLEWGSGGATRDVTLSRTGAGHMQLTGSLTHLLAAADAMGLSVRAVGDTTDRLAMDASGTLAWGPGNAAADIHMHRAAAGLLLLDENLSVTGLITVTGASSLYGTLTVYNTTNLRVAAAEDTALDVRAQGDAQPRLAVNGYGDLSWGNGTDLTDTSLYRDEEGGLVTPGDLTLYGGLYFNGNFVGSLEAGLRPSGRYETTCRFHAGTASNVPSGQLILVPIYLPANALVLSIGFVSSATAAASPTHQWFMLLNSSRVGLARTADATTAAWAANTAKALPIAQSTFGPATSYLTPYYGLYYLGLMITATTVPSLIGEGLVQAVASVDPGFGGSTTGMTTPPTVTGNAYTAPAPTGQGYSLYGYVVTA